MPEAPLLANPGTNLTAAAPASHRSTRLLEYLLTNSAEAGLDERQIAALTKLYYHVQVDDAPTDAFAAIVRLLSLEQFRNAVMRFARNAPAQPAPIPDKPVRAASPVPARAAPLAIFPFRNELIERLSPWAGVAVVGVASLVSVAVLVLALQGLSGIQDVERAARAADAALVAQLGPKVDSANAAFLQVERRIGSLGERIHTLTGDLQKQRAGLEDALVRSATAVSSLADAVKRTEIELPPPAPAAAETGGKKGHGAR